MQVHNESTCKSIVEADAFAMHPSQSPSVRGSPRDECPLQSDAPTPQILTGSGNWLAALPPSCDVLRPYQRELLRLLAPKLHEQKRILVQAPTGAGKTHVIAALVLCAHLAGLSVLILATRTRLVRQLQERLDTFGVPHGVIAAKLPELRNRNQRVQIASADTLYRRCLVHPRMPLPSADIVIFDEAHLAAAPSRAALLDEYPNAWRVGFTATPARRSGRPLRDQFDHLILGPTVSELIAIGALVRPRVFNAPVVAAQELQSVRHIQGDFAVGELSALMSSRKLIGDVVENWQRLALGKRTIVFAVDKRHGAALVRDFLHAGVPAELLTDADDEDAREAAIARLERGDTRVLVNCFLLSYGVDIPAVECISIARPTRSVVLYLQMVGRGLRCADGKESVLVLDHGRVVETLGMPTADFHWSLEAGSNVNRSSVERLRGARREEQPRTCPECQHMWLVSEEGQVCRNCGWTPQPKARAILVEDADLVEVGGAVRAITPSSPEVERFYRQALDWYARKWPERWADRPKAGRWWAWLKTRERFGFADAIPKPSAYWQLTPLRVTTRTAGWIKSRHIRDLRRRQRA